MEKDTRDRGLHADLTEAVLAAAFEVHSALGPGLLESAYEACLAHELGCRGLRCRRQVELPVRYKDEFVDAGYRIDLLIEEAVVVELKATDKLQPINEAQLLTYLKLSGNRVGLLLNFNTIHLRDGIKRRVL